MEREPGINKRDLGVEWRGRRFCSVSLPHFAKELEPGARRQAGRRGRAPLDPSCQLLGVSGAMNVQTMPE
jgi:hypothetical protein